ncbi:uncharacterized protein LOC129916077 [Episyrphus balteatus]|uniref:uncharacterized protein LOC129916077 n=1 Tax=Episyrphus balteatus TaxID=286459 RepID=UPI0024852E8E|nr:uncharacterized protein LOC129916077 [Episyrphus balteatus]
MHYFCFVCTKTFPSISFVISHLRIDHFFTNEENITLKCVANQDCCREFSTYSGLRRHVKSCVNIVQDSTLSPEIEAVSNEISDCNEIKNSNTGNDFSSQNNDLINFRQIINNFSNQALAMGIAQCNVTKLLKNASDIVDTALANVEILVDQAKLKSEIIDIQSLLSTCKDSCINDFKQFDSSYKRQKQLTFEKKYVSSISKSIGGRWEKKFDSLSGTYKDIFVQCTFQYIPILETLNSLFLNESFQSVYFSKDHNCNDEDLNNFCCAKAFKSNSFFLENPNAIQLQLFYDDFEVVNPLGSKTTIHKIGAVYFTLLNLGFNINSRTENIHLVSLFYANDIKNAGCSFNTILKPIVDDIMILEKDGIRIDNNITLRGSLVSLSHDNLGANCVLGFVESFRATYFCRLCSMTRTDTQLSFIENQSLIRSSADYSEMFSLNNNQTYTEYGESKGVKRYCLLNNIQYFNIFNNPSVDIMHDILEGTAPFIMRAFLKKLVENGVVKEDQLNIKIQSFRFGYLFRKSLPSNISLEKSPTNLGLTASQNHCLILHFPLIFHEYIDIFPHLWEGITSMLNIINIVFAPQTSILLVESLRNMIEKHLRCIVEQFQISLLPKHHFLTHYCRVIQNMGPLINMSTCRYEAKHRYFTKLNASLNNYINICKTLAVRHQQYFFHNWHDKVFDEKPNYGTLTPYQNLPEDLVHLQDKTVIETKFVEFSNGFHYKKDFFLKKNSTEFLRIKHIFLINSEIYFYCQEYNYSKFDDTFNLCCVENKTTNTLTAYKDLIYKKPFECYYLKGMTFVLVPYIIQ